MRKTEGTILANIEKIEIQSYHSICDNLASELDDVARNRISNPGRKFDVGNSKLDNILAWNKMAGLKKKLS